MVNAVGGGQVCLIDRANLTLGHRDSLGVAGESGSGKSMLCPALIGTLGRYGAGVTGGSIRFQGNDLSAASERAWRKVRGRRIGYVPQSSMAGLNPVLTVGTQMLEAVTADTRLRGVKARAQAIHYLDLVQLPRAALDKRAHELSGGMRQRIMIAAALARKPELLVADEPTTAAPAPNPDWLPSLAGRAPACTSDGGSILRSSTGGGATDLRDVREGTICLHCGRRGIVDHRRE